MSDQAMYCLSENPCRKTARAQNPCVVKVDFLKGTWSLGLAKREVRVFPDGRVVSSVRKMGCVCHVEGCVDQDKEKKHNRRPHTTSGQIVRVARRPRGIDAARLLTYYVINTKKKVRGTYSCRSLHYAHATIITKKSSNVQGLSQACQQHI